MALLVSHTGGNLCIQVHPQQLQLSHNRRAQAHAAHTGDISGTSGSVDQWELIGHFLNKQLHSRPEDTADLPNRYKHKESDRMKK